MSMNIYNPDGSVLIENVPITSNAKHYEEMMKSNYVKLSWNDNEYKILPTGAYIVWHNVRYKLFEDYQPAIKDEVKCVYEPEFQHPVMILDHTPCLFATRNSKGEDVKEPTWVYTGGLQLIVGRVQTIIAEELGVWLDSSITVKSKTVPTSVTISFDGDTIWSALGKICQAWNNEIEFHVVWDITRGTAESVNGCIYIGDISINDSGKGGIATLADGVNVVTTARQENNKNSFANYFVVRGGTRNITTVTASGNNVQTDTRMTLNSSKYPGSVIDKRANNNVPKIQDILIFDDIYPSLTLYCYNIRERVRRRQDEDGNYIAKEYNTDGSVKSYKMYSVYYMRLAYPTKDANGNVTAWTEFPFNKSTDMIDGKTLKCSFQANEEGNHSALAGRDFELTYHTADRTIPASATTGDSGVYIKKGDWEIVFEEDDDFIIPNSDTLQPYGESSPSIKCDTLLLYNILLTGDYLVNAQNKLEASALEEIDYRMTDYDNYTVKSYPHIFKQSKPSLFVGQQVNYTNREGQMDSHIIKIETSLECEYVQTITLGNARITGTITSVKDDVSAMSGVIDVNTSSISSITATLSKIMKQIREWANNFLSRVEDDIAAGHITFDAGLTANKVANLKLGAKFGDLFSFNDDGDIIAHTITSSDFDKLAVSDIHKDKMGYTIAVKDKTDGTYKLLIDELRAWSRTLTTELVVSGNASNGDFVSGFLGGKGWGITPRTVTNSAGVDEQKWTAEFDNIVVRGGLKVYEMVVSQLVGENDNRVFTGMLEVDHYDKESGKAYLNTNDGQTYNPFRTGDYIMVQQFTYDTSESNDVTKGYELIVEEYGNEGEGEDMLAWVTFSNFTSSFIENPTPETLIAEGDTFVRVDNISDPDRKGIVQIVSVGTASPYIDVIHGMKTDPNDSLKVRLGNLAGIIHPNFGSLEGFGLYSSNAYLTGDFTLRRTGEDLDTKFQILEDKFSSRFAKTEDGLTDDTNFLHNGRFNLNDLGEIDGWTEEGDDPQWFIGPDGLPFMVNGQPTKSGVDRITLESVGGKKVLHLAAANGVKVKMCQANDVIKQPSTHTEYTAPEYDEDGHVTKDAGEKEVNDTLYLSLKILPKAGTELLASLGETQGMTISISNSYDADLAEWQTVEQSGIWDGKGNFTLAVEGDCYITDVMLTTDSTENLKASYETSITQTDKKIELQAVKTTNTLKQYSTITQTADSISAKVGELENNLKDDLLDTGIDITNKKVVVTANKFEVQNNSGTTTMTVDADGNLCTSGNGSFKGTVYADNGIFKGTVYADSGSFKGTVCADGGSFKNMEAENITGKNFTLESGKIACFDFTSSYIGVASDSSQANTLHLSESVLVFNGENGKQVAVGPGSGLLGSSVLARFTSVAKSSDYSSRCGIYVNVDSGMTLSGLVNDAIQIGGGCVSGFKLRTEYIEKSDTTINQLSNAVLINANNYPTVYMPDFGQYMKYNGHVIMVKRWGTQGFKLVAQGSNAFLFQEGQVSQTNESYAWNGCSATFVFFPYISSGNYHGLWVEWRGVHSE